MFLRRLLQTAFLVWTVSSGTVAAAQAGGSVAEVAVIAVVLLLVCMAAIIIADRLFPARRG